MSEVTANYGTLIDFIALFGCFHVNYLRPFIFKVLYLHQIFTDCVSIQYTHFDMQICQMNYKLRKVLWFNWDFFQKFQCLIRCSSKKTLFTNLNNLFLALVHPENQLNAFLAYSGVDAWRVIEIPGSHASGGIGEFLLVFQTLAIYVDFQGRKSRDREIMYPAVPTHISMQLILVIFFILQKLNIYFNFQRTAMDTYQCIQKHIQTFSILRRQSGCNRLA